MNSNNLTMNSCVADNNQYVNQNWFQQHLQPFQAKKLFENNLTFPQAMATTPEEEDLNIQRKKSSSRDPLSHRIIEKRRRDRMNNCLADLSRLIPTSYLKKSSSLQGRGRIEKTEIIEMAIKHMKHLQAHKYCSDDSKCELSNAPNLDEEERLRQYRLGYQECLSEAVRFLVEIEGLFTGDGLCRRMMDYLQNHMSTIQKVSPVKDLEAVNPTVDDIPKADSPSLSDSTASANEKMDTIDSDLETKPFASSKPVVTSHLREMLESSSISSKRCKSSPHITLAASRTPSVSPNSQNNDQNVYNFKKEIKDRFQADQKVCPPSKSYSPVNQLSLQDDERVSNSSLSSLTTQASDHRSETSGYSSNSSNKSSVPSLSSSMFVPIFALHPSGNYYMPLTVDASVIAPYYPKESEINLFPVLHPINITVNFSYQLPQSTSLSHPSLESAFSSRSLPQWPSHTSAAGHRSVSMSGPPPSMTALSSNAKLGYTNGVSALSDNTTTKYEPIWNYSTTSRFGQMLNKIK